MMSATRNALLVTAAAAAGAVGVGEAAHWPPVTTSVDVADSALGFVGDRIDDATGTVSNAVKNPEVDIVHAHGRVEHTSYRDEVLLKPAEAVLAVLAVGGIGYAVRRRKSSAPAPQ